MHAYGSPIRCISLDSFLREWLAREPGNPYVAVFAPLIIDSDAELTQRAPVLWQTIQQAPLDAETRETLSKVLEFWFFERLSGKIAQKIWTMLNLVTPLEETKAYQSIFAKGEAKGKAATLHRLLTRRFGPLPTWAAQRVTAASEVQLDTWLDGIFDATSIKDLFGDESERR